MGLGRFIFHDKNLSHGVLQIGSRVNDADEGPQGRPVLIFDCTGRVSLAMIKIGVIDCCGAFGGGQFLDGISRGVRTHAFLN